MIQSYILDHAAISYPEPASRLSLARALAKQTRSHTLGEELDDVDAPVETIYTAMVSHTCSDPSFADFSWKRSLRIETSA